MKDKLKELIKTQEICSVYSNVEETTKFSVGYILYCDNKFFVIERIDSYGKGDGIGVELIDNVIKLSVKDQYNERIEKLFNYHKQTRYPKFNFGKEILKEMVSFAKDKTKLCTIELCDSYNQDIIGYITKITANTIQVHCVDENGGNDGISQVDISTISSLGFDSCDEQKIEILNKLNT